MSSSDEAYILTIVLIVITLAVWWFWNSYKKMNSSEHYLLQKQVEEEQLKQAQLAEQVLLQREREELQAVFVAEVKRLQAESSLGSTDNWSFQMFGKHKEFLSVPVTYKQQFRNSFKLHNGYLRVLGTKILFDGLGIDVSFPYTQVVKVLPLVETLRCEGKFTCGVVLQTDDGKEHEFKSAASYKSVSDENSPMVLVYKIDRLHRESTL